MHIRQTQDFLPYYQKIKKRTLTVVLRIPESQLDYRPHPNKFSLGDLARHIILIERDLYIPGLKNRRSSYKGCDSSYAESLVDIHRLYESTMYQLETLLQGQPPNYYSEKCSLPNGNTIRREKWLRLMLEHEIHHRGQIYLLLSHLGVPIPQIFEMSSEDVIRLSV